MKYLAKVKGLIQQLDNFEILYVPRDDNTRIDILSKLASSSLNDLGKTVEVLPTKSIEYIWLWRSRSLKLVVG